MISVQPRRRPRHSLIGWALWGLWSIFGLVMVACQASPPIPTHAEILQWLYGPQVEIITGPQGVDPYLVRDLSPLEREQFNYTNQFETRLIYAAGNWQNEPHQWIVLTHSEPPDCCKKTGQAVIGAAVLKWEAGSWQVQHQQAFVTYLNSLVILPQAELIELGAQQTALRLGDLEIEAGVARNYDLLIAGVGERLVIIARFEVQANNAGACPPASQAEPCWAYSASYTFSPQPAVQFPDLEITTSGTRLTDTGLVSFTEAQRWIFNGQQYQWTQP